MRPRHCSSRSSCSERRAKALSRSPLRSPARTTPMYSGGNSSGYAARARSSVSPRSTCARTSSRAARTRPEATPAAAPSACGSGSPAGSRAAMARVTSSTSRRLPAVRRSPAAGGASRMSTTSSPRSSSARASADAFVACSTPRARAPEGCTAWKAKVGMDAAGRPAYCQLRRSASSPSPPGCPSAPRESRSNPVGLACPGKRYT